MSDHLFCQEVAGLLKRMLEEGVPLRKLGTDHWLHLACATVILGLCTALALALAAYLEKQAGILPALPEHRPSPKPEQRPAPFRPARSDWEMHEAAPGLAAAVEKMIRMRHSNDDESRCEELDEAFEALDI